MRKFLRIAAIAISIIVMIAPCAPAIASETATANQGVPDGTVGGGSR